MVFVVDKVGTSLFLNQSITPKHFLKTPNCRIITTKRRSFYSSTLALASADHNNPIDATSNNNKNKKGVPHSNYAVPFDSSSCITRPLAEILRDLNKRIPDNIIIKSTASLSITTQDDQGNDDSDDVAAHHDYHPSKTYIPWYHANRMLSFYAPGWCGEIRDVIFSDNGSVTVVYRVTIRGSDGEAHRESTGTVSPITNGHIDAVAAAEEIAFCRACARFGLGLYLYHDE